MLRRLYPIVAEALPYCCGGRRLYPNVAEALPYCCGGFTLLLRRLYTNVAEAICVLLSIIISNQQNFIEFLVGLWQFSKSLAINSGFK